MAKRKASGVTMDASKMPPVVFLGPSAPASDILAILPDAIIRPPAQRGDLYAYRILKHTHFLILDGAFGGVLAISPREVVDVVSDGAVLIGASSMGALRAADCSPAGMRGVGLIYRLFRTRLISSEDEVAVQYHGERPFPPLTEPLVNVRIAARRANRLGLIATTDAEKITAAAQLLHFTQRSWSRVVKEAGSHVSPEAFSFLRNVDVKRTDAVLAANYVAAMGKSVSSRTPSRATYLFGLLGDGRERRGDSLSYGARREQIEATFVEWLWLSGRARKFLREETDGSLERLSTTPSTTWNAVDAAGELEAELMRFDIFERAVSKAKRCQLRPDPSDFNEAEAQLAGAHGFGSWRELLASEVRSESLSIRLDDLRNQVAAVRCLRRTFLFPSGGVNRSQEGLRWHSA
ncbi:TfuA-like protein [Rhizobium cauense]|uniref:TfuA-like protein n=1 Tax=Rhizobium cauense TaxID=1166683 RepID=UPI001CB77471|nr:TfuA-like protein [Rhizobium cauense]